MNTTLSRNLAIAGIALCAACASAQQYPIEIDVSPAATSVLENSTFYLNIIARSTDGLSHPLSLVDINVQWQPSLFIPKNVFGSPWYQGMNGFNFIFAPTDEGVDGAQLGAIGGNNAISPANVNITSTGLVVMQLRFTSLNVDGTGAVSLPETYGGNETEIQYNQGGVQTVWGKNLAGLNGGTVTVGALPEPVSIATLAMGIVALLRRRGRR